MLEQRKIESHRARIVEFKRERLQLECRLEAATEACAKAFAERRTLAAKYGEALGVAAEGPLALPGPMLADFRKADAAWLKALREQRDASTALLDSIHLQGELEAALVKLEAKAAA